MSNIKEIKVPDIGDFSGVDVIEVLVGPGDLIALDDPLITLESDKASMDIPAPEAGVVKEVKTAVGDKVSEGSVIVLLEVTAGGEAAAADDPHPRVHEAGSAAAAPGEAGGGYGGGTLEDIHVPDIGDFADVDVIEVLVAEGDQVSVDDPLITLESDKASMDVPSPLAGMVKALKIGVGDKVSEGTLILTLEHEGAAPSTARATPAAPTAEPGSAVAVVAPGIDAEAFKRVHASPSARRLARELGVDLARVAGSGRKSRVTADDVRRFQAAGATPASKAAATAAEPVAAGMGIPPIPAVNFGKFGEIEERPLSRIQRISGPHLHRSWLNVPMVTHHDEADITELEAFRQALKPEAEKRGVRVTALAFITKAMAAALIEFPTFNASLSADGGSLVLKKYCHIGIAVDTPNGLMVPVIRDVDKKGIYEIGEDMAVISKKARDGKLGPTDMQGGSISISSLGGIGGTAFTPIVNAPEVAILGVTRSRMQPVWNGKEFVPRLMQPLDLTYDHRVIDGAQAARFMRFLCATLGDLRRLIL
jgi:pyruvate dehydrogenase E2 component (dihydrolipoamide acetyltransferase)